MIVGRSCGALGAAQPGDGCVQVSVAFQRSCVSLAACMLAVVIVVRNVAAIAVVSGNMPDCGA